MSATLRFEPLTQGESLSYVLRSALEKRYEMPCTLNAQDLNFLNGLLCAGISDAIRLIEAIDKHWAVRIWLEY